MENDYPTEEELEFIRKYDYRQHKNSFKDLINHLRHIWHWEDWGYKFSRNRLELHTGGWSGNEEIIDVLSKSSFWLLFWHSSVRGGHYYFKTTKRWQI